jgi:lactate dehydrogenase-like 2-hydroxyacid dehydrogenase
MFTDFAMTRKILAMGSMMAAEMEELDRHAEVIRLWKEPDPEGAIREHSHDIKAILSTYNTKRVSRALIEALPNLEIIVQYGMGYENIDLEAAKERQIPVTNTPDVVTDDTADIAIALILGLARRIVEGDMFIRIGKWSGGTAFPPGTSLHGKTAGIVGLGRIGKAVASRAEAFGMNIVYYGPREKKDQPYPYFRDLREMAVESDFMVATCPGGSETKHLIDLGVLKALGSKGFLVNVARGPVVKEEDLLIALSNKAIAGAGLDVYENEPNVPEALFSMDNVILLPHIGGATLETKSKMGQLVIENLLAHFEGRPLLTPV